MKPSTYQEIQHYFDTGIWELPNFYNTALTMIAYRNFLNIRVENGAMIGYPKGKKRTHWLLAPKSAENVAHTLELAKKNNWPRLRIFAPSLKAQSQLVDLGFEKYWQVEQAVFNPRAIAAGVQEDLETHSDNFLKDQSARRYMRRNLEGLEYRWNCFDLEAFDHIVAEWSGRAAQAGVEDLSWRDVNMRETLAELHEQSKVYCSLALRKNFPAAFSVYIPITGAPGWAAQAFTKALNYQTQNGGYGGTGRYMLYQDCRHLSKSNIRFINAGSMEKPGSGLYKFKQGFKDTSITVTHWIQK
ncbi:MAG: hypothetical protein OEX12_01300 [Gammaproteobacteria bacterium]|nr:hypothetical protein [Gammaproteobacteria bacterium]